MRLREGYQLIGATKFMYEGMLKCSHKMFMAICITSKYEFNFLYIL